MLESKYIYFKVSVQNTLDCYIRKFGTEWKKADIYALQNPGWTLVGFNSEFVYFRTERMENANKIIQLWESAHYQKILHDDQNESKYNVYDRYWRRWVFLAGFDTLSSAESYAKDNSRDNNLTAIIPNGDQVSHVYINEELVWRYNNEHE